MYIRAFSGYNYKMEWFGYDKNKYYLSGIDWVINALDFYSKKRSGHGNFSQVVFVLSGRLDGAAFRDKLKDFCRVYPVLSGGPARDLNLCPYWRTDGRCAPFIWEEKISGDPWRDLYAFAARDIGSTYLRLFLVNGGDKDRLAVKFDHRLFDAAGIEAFFARFERYCRDGKALAAPLVQAPGLCRWGEKFLAGRAVNRFFLKLRKGLRPIAVKRGSGGLEFMPIEFDEAQTAAIDACSLRDSGYLMFMPFVLAKSLKAVTVFNRRAAIPGLQARDQYAKEEGDYLVPVNINLRPKSEDGNVFFNHLSFLFFRVPGAIIADQPRLMRSLKEQFFAQSKDKISVSLQRAGMLMRIAPLSLLAVFLKKFFGVRDAAFSLAYLDRSAYDREQLCGVPVENILHLPVVPADTGLGIFFTRYRKRLSVVVSLRAGMLNAQEKEDLLDLLKRGLLGEG